METQVWRGYKKKDELTQEQEDWRQVFGYGKAFPGKPAEAEAVLDAWLADHPDVQDGKKGVARGAGVTLSQYSHLYTTCQKNGFIESKPYLDKEQFISHVDAATVAR